MLHTTGPNCSSQSHTVTHQPYPAFQVSAPFRIINPIAVADMEAASAAIPPDRVLDEPGKGLRKGWIELPGVDPLGNGLNNIGAAARPVAGRVVWQF
jgi:hypothetical protein